nr:MAG TPA: hypothetical protein [Caudoviricetes sp.]
MEFIKFIGNIKLPITITILKGLEALEHLSNDFILLAHFNALKALSTMAVKG